MFSLGAPAPLQPPHHNGHFFPANSWYIVSYLNLSFTANFSCSHGIQGGPCRGVQLYFYLTVEYSCLFHTGFTPRGYCAVDWSMFLFEVHFPSEIKANLGS